MRVAERIRKGFSHLTGNDHSQEFKRKYKVMQQISVSKDETVCSAIRREDGSQVEVRIITKHDSADKLSLDLVGKICDIPGVLSILDCYDMGESIYIVMKSFVNETIFPQTEQYHLSLRMLPGIFSQSYWTPPSQRKHTKDRN